MFNINNVFLIELKYSIDIKDCETLVYEVYLVWMYMYISGTQILFLYFVVHVDRIFISLTISKLDRINVRSQKQWYLGSAIYLGKDICVIPQEHELTLYVLLPTRIVWRSALFSSSSPSSSWKVNMKILITGC